ncbi:WD40 repeat domain-containing protein [Bradyrhizobium sp. Arg62]|nr:WD40 repeat domain-containing protein [Bradyrhizobium brasilense]
MRSAIDGFQLARLGHQGPLSHAEFDPQGKRAVTASYDRTVKLWNAETGEELLSFRHKEHALWAAFDRTGSKVVTSSYVGEVVVWDASTGTELNRLVGHTVQVRFVMFDDAGKKVLSLADDGTVRVWALNGGGEILRISGNGWRPKSAAFSSSGDQVLVLASDGTARIFSTASKTEIQRFEVPETIVAAAFDKSGERVVLGLKSGTLRIWKALSPQPLIDIPSANSAISAEQHDLDQTLAKAGEISSVSFDQSGENVVAVSKQVVTMWNIRSGDLVARLTGHTDTINTAEFDPTGERILTASSDGTARVWAFGHARNVARLEHDEPFRWITKSALDVPGRRAAVLSSYNGQIWDLSINRPVATLHGHTDYVDALLFVSQGKKIISGSRDRTVRIWDSSTGTALRKIEGFGLYPEISIGIAPNDHLFATAPHDDGSVRIWDTDDGSRFVHLAATGGPFRQPFFDSTSTRVAALSRDEVFVWDVGSGRKVVQVRPDQGRVLAASYAAKDEKLLVASQNGILTVWSAGDGSRLQTIRTGLESISRLVVSPSGEKVLVLAPKEVAVLDIASGARVGPGFRNEQDLGLISADFLGSDDRVILSTNGGPVWLWHVSSGEIIAQIAQAFSSNAISSPDPQLTLLTGNGHLYTIKPYPEGRALIEFAQKGIPRCLTSKERQEFFVAHQDAAWCKAARKLE